MKPIKIRYYGLLPLTRRQYLLTAFWVGMFVLGFLTTIAILAADRLPRFYWPWEPLPRFADPGWRGLFLHHFYSLMALFVVLEIIDIMVMLATFRHKEEDELARKARLIDE